MYWDEPHILDFALRYAGIRRAEQLADHAARWREYEAGKSAVRAVARDRCEYEWLLRRLAEWVGV